MTRYSFSGHESFYCKSLWLKKGFVTKGQEVNWPNTLNEWYLTKSKKGGSYILVNLETNKEKYYNLDAGRYIDKAPARMPAASDKMRMIYCYCFKPNGDKIKFW